MFEYYLDLTILAQHRILHRDKTSFAPQETNRSFLACKSQLGEWSGNICQPPIYPFLAAAMFAISRYFCLHSYNCKKKSVYHQKISHPIKR